MKDGQRAAIYMATEVDVHCTSCGKQLRPFEDVVIIAPGCVEPVIERDWAAVISESPYLSILCQECRAKQTESILTYDVFESIYKLLEQDDVDLAAVKDAVKAAHAALWLRTRENSGGTTPVQPIRVVVELGGVPGPDRDVIIALLADSAIKAISADRPNKVCVIVKDCVGAVAYGVGGNRPIAKLNCVKEGQDDQD